MLDKTSHRFKVPIIGDPGVGKTSLISRYMTNLFDEGQNPTIGVSSISININYQGNEIPIDIWDTAGQERFRSLIPLYIRDAALVLIVFSMDDLNSFESLNNWYSNIRDEYKIRSPIILCANKIDVDSQHVNREKVEEFAEEQKSLVIFTSAKDGTNIELLFNEIGKELFKHKKYFDTKATLAPVEKNETKNDCC